MTRKEFKMTKEQLDKIMDACKPVRYVPPTSPQENANRAWRFLGEEMGFDGMTVRPVPGKDDTYFTAEVKEKK